MKANEFVKKFGVHIADHCLNDCASPDDRWFIHHGALIDGEDFDDLKRLVESHELIGGDLEYAKKFYADCAFKRDKHLVRYKQAIADVESCMEVSSESN